VRITDDGVSVDAVVSAVRVDATPRDTDALSQTLVLVCNWQ